MEQPKDYEHFDTNDFIADDAFLQWVKFPDAESNAFWKNWLAAHPHKQAQIMAARAFILGLQFKEDAPAPLMAAASLERSLHRIAALEQQPVAVKEKSLRRLWWWAAAAVVAGGMALIGRQLTLMPAGKVQYNGLADGVRTIWLPDSSRVILNAHASVSFRPNWLEGGKREVWLNGEAFFDVRPLTAGLRTANAFVVHSNNLDIDVLGTSFNVKANRTFTNVTLNTGKIKVQCNELPNQPLVLSPGDFVQYSAKQNKIIKKKVNADLYAVWKEESQQLQNVTLQELAAYIEDIYGYKVRISGAGLAQTKLSGGLRVKDEKLLLETLSFALNVKITKSADTLFIQPKTNK
ncbi:MAG TPA: FecR domain-containing protein [Chitinophaga sp.]|uniref:FecR family protein n=1 Tax=Chitinophaga sp. TaxID=1869181 RepID=UPI002DBE4B88|nr:FecR domain-containing protein [Chitinophaga sp.]HEU4551735.1 FecR domain-containing protein [Chitinophaga sp.]